MLSETQKTSIRSYLGYSRRLEYSSTLEGAMDEVSATEETLIASILASLDALVSGATTTASAPGIKKVDEVEFQDSPGGLLVNSQQALFHVRRLASILGVEIGAQCPYLTQAGGPIPLG